MIVFDLVCAKDGHRFEAWFASSAAFAEQSGKGQLMCPLCGGNEVSKAVMAPRVASKSNQRNEASAPSLYQGGEPAKAAQQVLAALQEAQAKAIEKSTWVGRDFERVARAMDAGETDMASIHGQATRDQAISLMEDGISVMPLLVPFVPPDKQN